LAAVAVSKEGATNEDLLRAKHAAAVQHLLSALDRYEVLPVETIREITLEIGMMGEKGLDYADPAGKYRLVHLPGERSYGLQLICLMYAVFKRFARISIRA